MQEDKINPNDIDAEKTILGAVLAIDGLFDSLPPSLDYNCFYTPRNALIWQFIEKSYKAEKRTDMVTVVRMLKKDGYLEDAGGVVNIAALSQDVPYGVNFQMLADILIEARIFRETITQTTAIASRCVQHTASVNDIRSSVKNLYDFVLNTGMKENNLTHIPIAVDKDRDLYDVRSTARTNGAVIGVKTGLRPLDTILGGWQKNNLIILAARPAMGKTALALHFARWSGIPTLVFSIEMSEEQLIRRMVVTEAEINGAAYKNGSLLPSEIEQAENARYRLKQLPIYFNDKTPINISELRQISMKFKKDHEGDILIIVDYLQLVKPDSKTPVREQQIAEVSRGLKEISKVCDCPVISLAQLSRAVEQRGGDKRPQLSDLRESGQIEQDADMVIFIHRPEYYNITADENGNSTKGVAELIVAKNRDGGIGTVSVCFTDHLTKFHSNEPPKTLEPNHNFLTNDLPF